MALSDSAEEIKHLQRCMSDLLSVLALPAVWSGQELHQIVTTFHDALLATLTLDFLYTRLRINAGGELFEEFRTAPPHATIQNVDICQALDERFGVDPSKWPAEVRSRLGGQETSLLSIRLGIEGEIGIVVAGSGRADFPTQAERLLLSVAANQITVGLQQAHLLSEQKRIADELERRVAERTASLAAANEELKNKIAERKIIEDRLLKSEDLLRTSESKLRLVIDTIPSLSWCNLPDGSNEFLSKGWHDYTGLSPEQAKGWGWQAAFNPQDLPPLMKRWQELLISGESGEIEARLRRHDGVYRWFLIQVAPLREMGEIVRWYGTSTDINDRKLAEEALRASERNLALTINTIPALAWSARLDGTAESFNQHYLDYVGLTQEQAKDWGWANAVHPDDQNGLIDAWQFMMKADKGGECEARLRRRDGEYRWFLFRTNPLRDESGKTVKWYGTNTDIDDRKRAEEELRRSEAFLAEGQRLGRTGSFFWRVATQEIVWSEQVYRIFELDPGLTITLDLIGSRVHPEDLCMLYSMVEQTQSGTDLEYGHRLLLPGNRVKYLHLVGHGTRANNGQWEYVGAIQDVTERRLAGEALDKARSELAHVTRITSLSMLTASIAHEVNQPLSGIITNASTCLRMLSSDQPNIEGARETARRTIRDGNRASEVVTRLRALFKRKEVAADSIDLNDVAREVIALSLSELQSNGIMVRHEFAENLPAVKGDRVQLQQVILNLLRNASDAMRNVDDRPRQLLVKTESDDSENAKLTVQDNGMGFAPDAADRLFESFYTTKDDGMGIGLSVSRSIIEAHRGRLWASANDGPGSSFAFSIPIPHDCSVESTCEQ